MTNDLNKNKINESESKNHAENICVSPAKKPVHHHASKKSMGAHHWASALSGLFFSAFLIPDTADAVFLREASFDKAAMRQFRKLTQDDADFPIAKNCVSVINQLTGDEESNSSVSSGILLDGGRYVLTAMHVLTNAIPKTLRVVHAPQVDLFFNPDGAPNIQRSLDVLSEKHPEQLSSVKAMYPLGHFEEKEELRAFHMKEPEDLQRYLRACKATNADVAHLFAHKDLRSCSTQGLSFSVHGNDLALIELTQPIEGTVPWVHKIPDVLPENRTWDEALVLGYTHQVCAANKGDVKVFTQELDSGEKVSSWKAMAIRMEKLSLQTLSDAQKTLPEGYAPLPDAHVAYTTYAGTLWEELFKIPEDAPRHTGKPSNSCSGGLTLVRDKNADGTFGAWIPLGVFTTELLDPIATLDKMNNSLSGAHKAAAHAERAGWPQHQIMDVIAPSIKRNLLKVLDGSNPFPVMTPENEPALSPKKAGQATDAGKMVRAQVLSMMFARCSTNEQVTNLASRLKPEDLFIFKEIMQKTKEAMQSSEHATAEEASSNGEAAEATQGN